MPGFWDATIGGLIGSSAATTIFGALFLRLNRTIEGRIKEQFDRQQKIFESTRIWQEKALAELLGPLQMQFERTKRAFNRWTDRNAYLEGNVVRQGNQTILDLLLTKGHFVPPHLMGDAARLIEHYDAWLEAYDRERGEKAPEHQATFVFVGPDGFPFPSDSEESFKAEFRRLQGELYSK
jgi:hypothetical protein